MRLPLLALVLLTGCGSEANHLGNPLAWSVTGLATAAENAAYTERRGRVEVIVKTNFDRIIADITAGGGDVLTEAMDTARIPDADRPARVLQMQRDLGLYEANPGALVVALVVYGG